MKLTRENLDALFTAFNAALNKGLAKTWNGWQKWAMTVQSSGAGETYPLALVTGGMREWIGPRVRNKLDTGKLTVLNKDYEHEESVSRNDIEDDHIGLYEPIFEAMGVDAGNLWGRLATMALVDAGNWADGAAFFSSRTLGKKSTANNVVNSALSLANYETARARMMGFCDAAGSPLGLVPDLLMVGPSNESTAKSILSADLVVSGGATVSNVHKNECEVQVNPYLVGSDAGKWFLFCTSRGLKPVAVQKRKEGQLVRFDRDSDDCVRDRNECLYDLHYRGNAAAVQPLLVIGGNLG